MEENKAIVIFKSWTFRIHRFSCHHHQCKQGSSESLAYTADLLRVGAMLHREVASF